MYVIPAVTPVAEPPEKINATVSSELVQFTWDVISIVEPSK